MSSRKSDPVVSSINNIIKALTQRKMFLFSEHCYKNGNLKYPKNSYFNIVRCKIFIFKNVRRIVLDHK